MADKLQLPRLQNKGRSSLVLSEVQANLTARARKDATGLLACKLPQYFATVELNGKWGLIDRTGKFSAEPVYDVVLPFSCGRAAFYASRDSRIIFGSVFYDERDHEYDLFDNGCKCGGSNFAAGFCGYLDIDGSIVISAKFRCAPGFSEDLAGVALDGKWGFIRKDGTFAIAPRFSSARNFRNGIARVPMNCYIAPTSHIHGRAFQMLTPVSRHGSEVLAHGLLCIKR